MVDDVIKEEGDHEPEDVVDCLDEVVRLIEGDKEQKVESTEDEEGDEESSMSVQTEQEDDLRYVYIPPQGLRFTSLNQAIKHNLEACARRREKAPKAN